MREIRTIAVCAPQVPFRRGGAEAHVESLVRELKKRNYEVDLIQLPYKWHPHDHLFKNIHMWKSVDLTKSDGVTIDLLITTKFPSYFAQHPNRVLWLIHQYRQAYDLFNTPFSNFDSRKRRDLKVREKFIKLDTSELRAYERIYTNSQNTAHRLMKFNGISSTPLYHPPKLLGKYFNAGYGDYILSVGRLESLKRVDSLIKALKFCDSRIQCKIAGTGPDLERLRNVASSLEVSDRIEFLGYVSDERLLELYARCNCVYYAPLDEDFGYITLEAFLSEKPVITSFDSGGPLEFVEDGQNGLILNSLDEKHISQKIEDLFFDPEKCRSFGMSGYHKVRGISWDDVIETLLYG